MYTKEEINGMKDVVLYLELSEAGPSTPHIVCQEKPVKEIETSLMSTLQESKALTRLPVPEPTVFSGDSL